MKLKLLYKEKSIHRDHWQNTTRLLLTSDTGQSISYVFIKREESENFSGQKTLISKVGKKSGPSWQTAATHKLQL